LSRRRSSRPLREVLGPTDVLYLLVSVAAGGAALAATEILAPGWFGGNAMAVIGVVSALPLTALPMYSRVALGLGAVLWQVAGLGLVAALVPSPLPAPVPQVIAGGLVGGLLVSASTRRGTVGATGLWAGLTSAVVLLVAGRGTLETPEMLAGAAGAVLGGALSSALVLTLSPIAERLFGHVTTMTLFESLSYDHPLLRRLMTTAPGTFLHSNNLAVLADAGAHAIGLDPLTVRVGALYHDVGKTTNPVGFVENQEAWNPHDAMAPEASAEVFRAHVTDGLALVERHHLGRRIAAFVREHHGTALMRSLLGKPGASELPAATLRYDGPRPQSRETGLLMIADQVEATARALQPDSLEASRDLVARTIARIREEDELAESGLSDADLDAITTALAEVVHATYHRRIRYPPTDITAARRQP